MDSQELSEWIAVHRYFMPLPNPWHQTGVLASAIVAPHSQRGRTPKPVDFVPVQTPPQHQLQIDDAIAELRRQLRGE
jgi:hypothetical protein